MTHYSDEFLQRVRDALPMSRLVGRKFKLRKVGREFQAIDDPSLKISDHDQLYHDHGSGADGGNCFNWVMNREGVADFADAVKICADLAGISMPRERTTRSNGHHRSGNGAAAVAQAPPQQQDSPRQIIETYDYEDSDGGLRYQICRVEWIEKGKRKKTFMQRRPVDGHPGEWAWGLGAGEYVRGAKGDWYLVNDEREGWAGQRIFLDDVAHQLYRLAALREELAQDAADRRVIFLVEGERKVNEHVSWDLVATCASGGARHWLPHHADELAGADVVIEADNDQPGRDGAEKKAASLRNVAARVRLLDWGKAWPGCSPKSDFVDWKKAGGTQAKFWEIVDRLPDWEPARPTSAFRAFGYEDLDKPGPRLSWLIKGILTRHDVSIWFGDYGCGKSFLILDAANAVDQGREWFGRRVERGLVLYQAGEGGIGFRDRLRAYRIHHGAPAVQPVLQIWPTRVNLFKDDADTEKMIDEGKAWSAFFNIPLELVVIDTMSSATPGANENQGEDMGLILERARRISLETGAHVAIIHHVPKTGGTPRGWSGLGGNVDTLVRVETLEPAHNYRERTVDGFKAHRRHRFTIVKQKEGPDNWSREFWLKQVIVGRDEHGDDVTSCVTVPILSDEQSTPSRDEVTPLGYSRLNDTNTTILRALQQALDEKGTLPPAEIKAPDLTKCVRVGDWIEALAQMKFAGDPGDTITERFRFGTMLHVRCKKAIERVYEKWINDWNLIGKSNEWVWRTSRRAVGVDPKPQSYARPEAAPLLADGETPDDLGDALTGREF